MESIVYIKTSYKSVFLLNGTFTEKAEGLKYDFREPLYITVLPLAAYLLPYTVKVSGNEVLANETLCNVYSLPSNRVLIKLKARYNYVYSPEHKEAPQKLSEAETFFRLVKSGSLSKARELLTKTLSDSIDDEALSGFFNDFTDIIKNDFILKNSNNSYFLVDGENKASAFDFIMDANLIDNIMQG